MLFQLILSNLFLAIAFGLPHINFVNVINRFPTSVKFFETPGSWGGVCSTATKSKPSSLKKQYSNFLSQL